MKRNLADRLSQRLDRNGPIPAHRPELGRCWIWTGYLRDDGYAPICVRTEGRPRTRPAHVLAWELVNGPVPKGLELDHLCRNHACCNPAHLEPVTRRENVLRGQNLTAMKARQTHCIHGHPFDEANTYRKANGARGCRACGREHKQRARARASEVKHGA